MKVTIYKNKRTNKAVKMDLKRLVRAIVLFILLAALCKITVDFIRFPECYITTWKYQLQNDLEAGDERAIEYYRNVYVNNGRELFD